LHDGWSDANRVALVSIDRSIPLLPVGISSMVAVDH
jgi:hypothetical protein